MNLVTNIHVKTTFEAFHNWPTAPEAVIFLQNPHRHLFYVNVKVFVSHDDRDVEFFMLKKEVDTFLYRWQGESLGPMSCEMMATQLLEFFVANGYDCFYTSVYEDDENGAEVWHKSSITEFVKNL